MAPGPPHFRVLIPQANTTVSGSNHSRFRPLPVPIISGYGHFRFRPLPVPITSGSDRFRLRSFPVPIAFCSDHFRFRSVLIPIISGYGHFRFRPFPVPNTSGSRIFFRPGNFTKTSLAPPQIDARAFLRVCLFAPNAKNAPWTDFV